MTLDPRVGRFADPGTSGVEAGLRGSAQQDTLNKKYIARNIKPYKSLKKYGSVKGLKGLKNKNYAQLERMASIAVLRKSGVKRQKLRTSPNRSKFKPNQIKRARTALGANRAVGSIQNKKVRKAARHLTQVRRNRRVMKTNIFSGKGYDIWKGYT